MEYEIRTRDSNDNSAQLGSWLDAVYYHNLAAAYQLPSTAALLLSQLQNASAADITGWKRELPDVEDEDDGEREIVEEKTTGSEDDDVPKETNDDEAEMEEEKKPSVKIEDDNETSVGSWVRNKCKI